MNKKPTSVQFKFFEDLKNLTDPTEPRLRIVRTAQIPAQDKTRLRKAVKRHRKAGLALLWVTAVGLVLCGLLFLAALHIF